mmetsp:Transcript_20655/g.58994  ORF Transcript_20655/g.58994 Transcript_20655/m.58994 type:complete len:235 (-) Transcript_20655:864-1568(-)
MARSLREHLLHVAVDAQVLWPQDATAYGTRPPVVHGPHLHVAFQVGRKAEALQVHALLPAHRDLDSLEAQRAPQLQLVRDDAGDLLLLLVVHRCRPSVSEEGHDPVLRGILVALGRRRGDLLSRHGLRAHQGHHEAGGIVVLDADRDRVDPGLQPRRDVHRDVSPHVAFLRFFDEKNLGTVRLKSQSLRPNLRTCVGVHPGHAHPDALVLLPPCLQVRQVQREGDVRSHDDVAQ